MDVGETPGGGTGADVARAKQPHARAVTMAGSGQ